MTTLQEEHLSPDSLSVHPALSTFPGLSDDQLAALTHSVKEHGLQQPLIVDEEHQVYDGRARLGIAQALGLSTVSCIVRPEKNVVGFAIESAVNRRQLTRSAIAFVLFELHPELALTRGAKAGRPKNCSPGEQLSATHESYRQLGARYRVTNSYFSYLAEMRAECSTEQWSELRRLVLFEEASIPRQYAGFRTGRPAGSKRGPVVYAALDAQGLLQGILPNAFASLRNGFAAWRTEIPTEAKAAVEKEWASLLEDAPVELLRIAARKAGRS